MLFTVAPPVCVAKYSTKKNTGHTTNGNGSSLKLNSVYAVKLKNKKSRTRGYKTPVPVKGTGCDKMIIL